MLQIYQLTKRSGKNNYNICNHLACVRINLYLGVRNFKRIFLCYDIRSYNWDIFFHFVASPILKFLKVNSKTLEKEEEKIVP